MGGGGGISPVSIVSSMVFGKALSALTGMATADPGPRQSVTTSADTALAEQAAAEARRKADRQKAEAALLAKTRQADRVELASQDSKAESLGAPLVAAAQLKERLGQ